MAKFAPSSLLPPPETTRFLAPSEEYMFTPAVYGVRGGIVSLPLHRDFEPHQVLLTVSNPDHLERLRSVSISCDLSESVATAEAMRTVLSGNEFVGLASVQMALPGRVVAVRVKDDFVFMVDPLIYPAAGQCVDSEGCGSIPSLRVDVSRHSMVRVTYTSLSGERLSDRLSGLAARALQHEVDHLNGVLITDRAIWSSARWLLPSENPTYVGFPEGE